MSNYNHNIISQEQELIDNLYTKVSNVSENTNVIYSDSVYNTNRIYTNKYLIETQNGLSYYGVRTVPDSSGNFAYFNIDGINVSQTYYAKNVNTIYYFNEEHDFLLANKLQHSKVFNNSKKTYEYLIDGITDYPKYTFSYNSASYVNIQLSDCEEVYKNTSLTDNTVWFDLIEPSTEKYGYVNVAFDDVNTSIFYEKEYKAFNLTTTNTSNKVFNKIVKNNSVNVYNRVSFNENDLENLYVENNKYTSVNKDKLNYGDEYYVKAKNNTAQVNYLHYTIGKNENGDMFYGKTFAKLMYPSTTLTDEFIEHTNIYNKLQNIKLITSKEELNNLINEKVTIYTINSVFISNYVQGMAIDVSGKTVYLNKLGENYYEVIPLNEIVSKANILNDNNLDIYYSNLIPSKTKVTSTYISWAENTYYYDCGNNDEYFLISKQFLTNEFTGDLYIYEINAIGNTLTSRKVQEIIKSNEKLYRYSYLYDVTNCYTSIATNEKLYYSEIDKDKLTFIDANIFVANHNFTVAIGERIPDKEYYAYTKIKVDGATHTFKTKEEADIIIKSNKNIKVIKAYQKTTEDNYILIKNGNDNLDENLKNPNYIQYIRTKYLYSELTNNTGILSNSAGTLYTNIEVYDPKIARRSISIPVFKHEKIDANYVYTEIKESFTQIFNETEIISTNNEEYYIKKNGSNEYIQLTNLDESPTYYLTHKDYNVFIKTKTYKSINYNANNYGKEAVHTQYCDTEYNPICITIGNKFYAIYATSNSISLVGGYKNNYLELVPLYPHITSIYNTNAISYVTKDTPLYLTNNYELVANGTYTWNFPQTTYYIENNIWKKTESLGYWSKNYDKIKDNLNVSTYVYYANNIDNVSRTYTMIPDSTIVQSIINYPKIEYKTKLPFSKETEYFTYVKNGYSYVYSDNRVEYKDGMYNGIVSGETVPLTKLTQIKEGINVETYVEQEEHVDYNYFTYQSAIQLTNARVPVLLNTTINPDVEEAIIIWDDSSESYITSTFKKSLSYYSYEYILEDKAFLVNSVINQEQEFVIENMDALSTYANTLVETVNVQNTVISNSCETISSSIISSGELNSTATDKLTYATQSSLLTVNQNLIDSSNNLAKQLSNINLTLSALSPLTINQAIQELGLTSYTTENTDLKHGVIKGTKIRTSLTSTDYKLVENIKIGDNVVSYNSISGEQCLSTVKNIQLYNSVSTIAKILLLTGEYVVIGEYTPVLTNNGFKTLKLYNEYPVLTTADLIMTTNGLVAIDSIDKFNNVTNETIYYIDIIKNGVSSNDNYYANDICIHNIDTDTDESSTVKNGTTVNGISAAGSLATTATAAATKFTVDVDNLSDLTDILSDEMSKTQKVDVQSLNTYLSNLSYSINETLEKCILGDATTYSLSYILSNALTVTTTKLVNFKPVTETIGLGYLLNKVVHYTDSYCLTPYKKAFIAETAQKLFTSVDFEGEIVDNVEYDENGNIIRKITHKNNPSEIAKRSIARAKILWSELEKAGCVKE